VIGEPNQLAPIRNAQKGIIDERFGVRGAKQGTPPIRKPGAANALEGSGHKADGRAHSREPSRYSCLAALPIGEQQFFDKNPKF